MRQFDVVAMAAADRPLVPYVVILQSDLLSDLATRLAAPLMAPERFRPIPQLNPIFALADGRWMMATQMMAAVPVSELGGEAVASLVRERDTIIRAVDFLLAGV